MKKETKEKIRKYEKTFEEIVEKGTKYTTALKALKELPIEHGFKGAIIQEAIKHIETKLDNYGAICKNVTHNLTVLKNRAWAEDKAEMGNR